MKTCDTENCERQVEYADQRWCRDCTAVVLRTGRPPVLPVKFVPAWVKRAKAGTLPPKVNAA
jgi:hypothetical protein